MCTFPARVVKGELGLPDKYCQEVEGGDPSPLYGSGDTKHRECGFGVLSVRKMDILDVVGMSISTKGHKDG